MDSIRGELSPTDAARLEARVAADPSLLAERNRVRSMLAAEQTAQNRALDDTLDLKAADRMAARILDRARREEGRRATVPGSRRLWARLLVASVAVHVLALGVLSWRHFNAPVGSRDAERERDVAWTGSAGDSDLPTMEPDAGGPGPEFLDAGAYVIAEELLPVETLIPDSAPAALSPSDLAAASYLRGSARMVSVRRSDVRKRQIDTLVGAPGSLDRVKASLAALARVQADDGSFPDSAGQPSVRATATVLLAFLGDGHSSHDGEHRAVVGRGIGWLYERTADGRAPLGDRSFALYALSEDLILSGGSLTPAEARLRRLSIRPLATTLREGAPGAHPEGSTGRTSPDARWGELALVAAARAGILPSSTMVATLSPFDVGSIRPGDDARTAMLDGTTLLKDPRLKQQRGAQFTEWNTATARTLSSRLGADGLASGPASTAAKAEETALILLALQVAYRTY